MKKAIKNFMNTAVIIPASEGIDNEDLVEIDKEDV